MSRGMYLELSGVGSGSKGVPGVSVRGRILGGMLSGPLEGVRVG